MSGSFVSPEDYLKVLGKRKFYLLAPVILALFIGFTLNKLQSPVYKATARILIEPSSQLLFGQELVRREYGYFYYQNQLEVIKSRSVAQKAALILNPALKGEELENTASLIQSSIRVSQASERQPGIIFITAFHSSPEMAAKIANAVAKAYQEEDLSSRTRNFQETYTFLTEKLLQLKEDLAKSRKKLAEFKRKNNLLLVGNLDMDMEKLSEFNAQYISTRAKRLELEVKLQQFKALSKEEKLIACSSFFPDNSVIQELKGELTHSKIQLSEALQKYKEKFPEVQHLKERIKLLEKMLEEEIDKSLITLETTINSLKAKEEALSKAINDYRKDAQVLSQKQSEFNLLQQEVNTNQEIYLLLTKKLTEADISKDLQESRVRILDYAQVPSSPIRPKKRMNILFSLVMGVFMGVGLSYIREFLDVTVKDAEEVEKFLGTIVLGKIPKVKDLNILWRSKEEQ